MNRKQYAAFLAYYGLGGDRSLELLHRDWSKLLPKLKGPRSLTTIKKWSAELRWQDRVNEMDSQANQRLFDEAINAARETRVDILKLFRAIVLRYATQLKDQRDKELSSGDVARFWEMARVEMGLPASIAELQGNKDKPLVTFADIIKKAGTIVSDDDNAGAGEDN